MFTRLLMLVLLVGACFAAPQTFDASVSGSVDVSPPSVPDVSVPSVSVPDATVPDVTVPDVTVPDVTVPGVTVPDVTVPSVTVPTGTVPSDSSAQDLIAALQAAGYTKLAQLFSVCPLSSLVPTGTPVTIPGIPNDKLTAIWNQLTDAAGKLDVTKVGDFLKKIIVWDFNTKAQLLQAAVGALKNLLNQTQNIKGFPNGGVDWFGGNITKPDIPFAGGMIQGVDNFVQKGSQTLTQLVQGLIGKVNAAVGALLGTLVNALTGLTGTLGNIFNGVGGGGNTFIMPNLSQLTTLLSPLNILNLKENIKKFIIPIDLSPNAIQQLLQSGQTSLATLFQGLSYPISSSSSHTFTLNGITYNYDTSFSTGSGVTVLTPAPQ